ncbi:juvenile hormone epoxide hydrolase-like [Cydia strobilella]|uniref:juvenile hormone epoxide hydrolase-like n=1 Tax=Cydia strobilella TaxID=1100964 RepID=UPI003007D258
MKNKKEKAKKSAPKQEKSLTLRYIVFTVLTVLPVAAAYCVFYFFATPPPMPEMDLKTWWGPYPISQKPDVSIRPFKIEFSDVIVNDLRERLLHRRPFTPPLEDAGFTYGFNSDFLTRVLDFWQNKYDFKQREQFLNQYSQFRTNIQGLDIHYVHVKPKVDGDLKPVVVPLLLLHGWPGSVREFYEMIPKLTTPRAQPDFVFELIIPSLPGFGFSQGASRAGLGPAEIAVVLHNLMQRIGVPKYYIQGGDAGHAIGSHMATLFPENVLGFHTNFPVLSFNPYAHLYNFLGQFWPSLVVEPELQSRMYPWGEKTKHLIEESGYMHIQATKPDTIGTALTDSPAGLAAYILEKFSTWTDPAFRKAGDGNLLSKFSLTTLLDNVMIYWASNSITTSVRLYAETFARKQQSLRLDEVPTEVPTWGIKFKHELVFHPDQFLKLKYKNYLHSTVVEAGGHFAALEHPDILADDVFEAVEVFRHFHARNNPEQKPKTIYDFTVKDINGKTLKLDKYKGYVLIIVNVASQCGYTDNHYKELNELYDKYAERGLRILAFPCNQFGGQEPGSLKDIQTFAKNKGAKFDLFEKVEVNGENSHPLWNFLKEVQSGTLTNAIKWNFSKFIVDRNGVPVERFGPSTNPLELETYLAKYW